MSIATALLEIQKAAPAIAKDATNPHYRSKYVSLDTLLAQITPILNQHGVVLVQHPTHDNGHPALLTKLIEAESGEAESSVMLLLAAKNDPQGQGSAITYARRYALMSALGLSADEDDDGHRASQPKAEPAKPEPVVMTSSEAITHEFKQLEKIIGKENAQTAYALALHAAGVSPGAVPTVKQTEMILASLREAGGVPA